MKTPETPRSYLPKLADPPAPEEKEAKIVPRYVEIPALREHGFGPRNLFWGVATLFLAIVLLVAALFFAGPKAGVSLATALLTFCALFVLARMHVFRQRNGAFFALALVCLLGAIVPLLESAFHALKNVNFSSAISAPATPATASTDGQPPLLTESFALTPPEGSGKRVKVVKDSRIMIDRRSFLLKAGDQFALVDAKGGDVTFAVRDLNVSLPSNVVEIIDPNALAQGVSGGGRAERDSVASTSPAAAPSNSAAGGVPMELTAEQRAAITMSAQKEAIRLYPALGVRDSMENLIFISTYKQMKDQGRTEMFRDPEWPIALANYLAHQEGWVRGAGPATTGPAPILDGPTSPDPLDTPDRQDAPKTQGTLLPPNSPALPSRIPPVNQLDAGAGLDGPR